MATPKGSPADSMVGTIERTGDQTTIIIPGLADALRREHQRGMGRWLGPLIMVMCVILVATAIFVVYRNSKVAPPVTTDGWLYSDATEVLFIVGIPGVGGQEQFSGVFYAYDIERAHVVSITQKYNGTVSNSHITLLDQGSPVYASGDFSGQHLILNIGPHGLVSIFAKYIFRAGSFADFTQAYQHLGT